MASPTEEAQFLLVSPMGTTSTASKWNVAGSAILFALAATVFGLVLANYLKAKNNAASCTPENSTVTVNATCVETRIVNSTLCGNVDAPCQVPYYVPEHNVCDPQSAVGGTACDNKCYVPDAESTVCDDQGQCTGNMTECKGYCTVAADCNTSLPLNPFWVGVNDSEANVPVFWWNDCMCWANMAEQFALIMFWQQDPFDAAGDAIGAGLRCKDLLDFDFVAQYESCLDISILLLDPLVTPNEHYLNVNTTDFTHCNNQFALCSYAWNCAILNQTFFPATRRSLHEEEGEEEEVTKPAFFLDPKTRERVERPRAQEVAIRLLERAEATVKASRKRAPPFCTDVL